MNTRLTLALLFAAMPLWAASSEKAAAAAVIGQERAWSAAFFRHDIRALGGILALDYVGTDGRGVMSTKADEIAEAQPPKPDAQPSGYAVLDETLSDFKVRVYGNVAVLTSRNDEKVRSGDREILVAYRRTTVWTKRDGRWQCVSFHASRMQ